jgi:hypothetical protein
VLFRSRTEIHKKFKQTGDFSLCSRDERSIVEGVEEEVYMEGRGAAKREVKRFKIKFPSLNEARDQLHRVGGAYEEDNRQKERAPAQIYIYAPDGVVIANGSPTGT